ncbi:DNA-binding MurR/RpiR family transcriptional regulator [Mycoplasmoides fastidiosum]|uniref:DNA-binding MurR/RpiR family transcriptional regulator n=1 Tax=Mycoplasmoides fastidiosum TaxID=92758 RepID=A0ABU0LYV2_9BACT|nr:SIS domain-containing protein [Mycoplasmoides fastidiosum]MDQ0513882.1 DNA-binding MurR/RpiR family transcriptional regulator [Mycoplasmoides fastidiosum]UUD37704.1 SIS domain-containing protein [Mycoplasmoides fastidiosum]
MDILVPETLKQAAEVLKNANNIICYGIGSSLNVANEMCYNLQVIGKNAFLANTIHDIFLQIQTNSRDKYVICFFSKSMKTKENKFLLSLLQKYGISVILITNNRRYVSENKTIVIHFYTLEQKTRIIALSSKVSQLFIADILLRKIYLSKTEEEKSDILLEFHEKWQ